MTKVRLHGMPEEVKKLVDNIKSLSPLFKILYCSDEYADRGKSSYVRVYMDVELGTAEEILGELDNLKING